MGDGQRRNRIKPAYMQGLLDEEGQGGGGLASRRMGRIMRAGESVRREGSRMLLTGEDRVLVGKIGV